MRKLGRNVNVKSRKCNKKCFSSLTIYNQVGSREEGRTNVGMSTIRDRPASSSDEEELATEPSAQLGHTQTKSATVQRRRCTSPHEIPTGWKTDL